MALSVNDQYNSSLGKDNTPKCPDYTDEIEAITAAIAELNAKLNTYNEVVEKLQCVIDSFGGVPYAFNQISEGWNSVLIAGQPADGGAASRSADQFNEYIDTAHTNLKDVKDKITEINTKIASLQADLLEIQSRPCFPLSTKVLTENGYKDIDKITINEKVLSYNENTKENELKDVLRTIIHKDVDVIMYKLLINGNIIEATSMHRFYIKVDTGYDWILAKDLKIGDIVMNKDGKYYTIDEITNIKIKETVYSLSVKDNHNFYVTEDNILVYSSCS